MKPIRDIDTSRVWLQPGSHRPRTDRDGRVVLGHVPYMCLNELIAWIAGEPWTDRPKCVSPLLGAYGRVINDQMEAHSRQVLKEFVPLLMGTGEPNARAEIEAADRIRAWTLARALFEQWLPAFLAEHRSRDIAELVLDAFPIREEPRWAAEMRELLLERRVRAWSRSHEEGIAVDRAKMFAECLVWEGINGGVAAGQIGDAAGFAYAATHKANDWSGAISVLGAKLLQV